jgi:hypothetical protein
LLKEVICFVGQSECYDNSSEILKKTMQLVIDDNKIYRVCKSMGEECEKWLEEERKEDQISLGISNNEVVYAHCDGSMLLTRKDGWKEAKVGRVYKSSDIVEISKDRGFIGKSWYTYLIGGHEEFEVKMSEYLERISKINERLVFITDGARWIINWITAEYPKATQILDFFHAFEHCCAFAKLAINCEKERSKWLAKIKQIMLEKGVDQLLKEIDKLECNTKTKEEERKKLINYIENNRTRMDYPTYIDQNLQIGSGAMEAAHRTLIQVRCKLSGQRWTIEGATNILNLRNLRMNGKWCKLTEHLNANAA